MFQVDGRWLSHCEWFAFLRAMAAEEEAAEGSSYAEKIAENAEKEPERVFVGSVPTDSPARDDADAVGEKQPGPSAQGAHGAG